MSDKKYTLMDFIKDRDTFKYLGVSIGALAIGLAIFSQTDYGKNRDFYISPQYHTIDSLRRSSIDSLENVYALKINSMKESYRNDSEHR